ncbi:MAG TPA: signal peptidase I [Candidatus Angelobacter sp.]|nr:signal peptidase I [Candidatus Angelobacter sp.]
MKQAETIEAPQVPQEMPVASDEHVAYDPREQAHPKGSVFGAKSLLSIAVIVVFVITFVVQAFRVPSESMENTLLIGDFLLADKLHFADDDGAWDSMLPYRAIHRGDIIVFRYPLDPSTYFVKRVIGLPGDRIHLKNKAVFVNDTQLKEPYALHSLHDADFYRDNFPQGREFAGSVCPLCSELPRFMSGGELVVPAGRYFVMGDNRDHSSDSRYWGFVPRRNVLGRPLVIYLSVRSGPDASCTDCDDKLYPSGQVLAPLLQLARWDRMFRLVR